MVNTNYLHSAFDYVSPFKIEEYYYDNLALL